jgi:hypothetical protein
MSHPGLSLVKGILLGSPAGRGGVRPAPLIVLSTATGGTGAQIRKQPTELWLPAA